MALTPEEVQLRSYNLINDLKAAADLAIKDVAAFKPAELPFALLEFQLDSVTPHRPATIADADIPAYTPVQRPEMLDTLLADAQANHFKGHVWESAYFDQLAATLRGFVTTGGVGVDTSVQDAIFAQGQKRLNQAMQDELDAANALSARSGFDIPTSMTFVARDAVIQRYGDKREDLNNKILEKMADLARQNIQDALAKGIEVERVHTDFTTNYNRVFTDLLSSIVRTFEAEVNANVAQFEGQIKALLAKLDLVKANSDLDLRYSDQMLRQATEEANLRMAKAQLTLGQLRSETEIRLATLSSTTAYYQQSLASALGQITGLTATTAKGK